MKNFREFTDSENREQTNDNIRGLSFDLLPHILNKDWMLFSAGSAGEFWIGDHPVALANNVNPGTAQGAHWVLGCKESKSISQ